MVSYIGYLMGSLSSWSNIGNITKIVPVKNIYKFFQRFVVTDNQVIIHRIYTCEVTQIGIFELDLSYLLLYMNEIIPVIVAFLCSSIAMATYDRNTEC